MNGGSDGATMRYKPECDHGGNAGLGIARKLLEPIKAKHPNVTYADLYILAGVVAVEEMGGPKVLLLSNLFYNVLKIYLFRYRTRATH